MSMTLEPAKPEQQDDTAMAATQSSEDPTSPDAAVRLQLSQRAPSAVDPLHALQQHVGDGSQPGSGGWSRPGPDPSVEPVQIVLCRAACLYKSGLYPNHAQAAALMPPDSQVLMRIGTHLSAMLYRNTLMQTRGC